MEEKERQLQAVSREREDLKAKLAQLQALFASFLQEKGDKSGGSTAETAVATALLVPAAPAAAATATATVTTTQPSSSASSTSSYVLLDESQQKQQAKVSSQENGERGGYDVIHRHYNL